MTQLIEKPQTDPVVPDSLIELHTQLCESWNASTAFAGIFDAARPSAYQSVPTALVVQHRFGGDIIRVANGDRLHYFNRLPSGEVADLTRDQFDQWDPTEEVVQFHRELLAVADHSIRFAQLRFELER